MFDTGPDRGPQGRSELFFYLLFLTGVLAMFAAEVWFNYEPTKLAALFFVLFWAPMLAVHEGGHAAAAWLAGWHVSAVVIGMGRPVGAFRVGQVPVFLLMFPVEGFVLTAPRDLKAVRLKSAFIYFAGPGIELLLAAVILLALGPDRMFTRSTDVPTLVWQSLALVATVGGVLNLIPHALYARGKYLVSDGLGIIRSFTRPEGEYVQMIHNPDDWYRYAEEGEDGDV